MPRVFEYSRLWPLLSRMDPERAHRLALVFWREVGRRPWLRRWVQRMAHAQDLPRDPVQVAGLAFPNRVGLAAGYDKDAYAWRGLAALGFGHIEVGTVTLMPQPGNPRPRLWRIPEHRALINRLGFPSKGAPLVARRLQGPRPPGLILGVNIGHNHGVPPKAVPEQYARLFLVFAPWADYLTVNVSCPNVPGYQQWQGKKEVMRLLVALRQAREAWRRLSGGNGRGLPIFVKLSPDLSPAQLDDTLEGIVRGGAEGIIATNTTTRRPGLDPRWQQVPGGLSGAPLRDLSTQFIADLHQRLQGRLPIIGVGGIMSPEDAQEKLQAGAQLVQVFTGLVYEGPALIPRLIRSLAAPKQPEALAQRRSSS
ncbi:MAG: quinone-dependent dihydroorotate dehydrogenase [Chloroflexi bacterium]|nr:quinone-dependent dihydroorotate dehydrogenase [Chloroflexota bacterium]